MEKKRLASNIEKREYDLVLKVCELEKRTVAGFVRIAVLERVNEILKDGVRRK